MSRDPRMFRALFKKRAAKVAALVLGVLLLLGASGFFVLDGYLNQVRYDSGVESILSSIPPEPEDDTEPAAPESPAPPDVAQTPAAAVPQEAGAPVSEDRDVFHMLLIGTDSRVEGVRGRSDAMILVSVNRRTSKITVTSLMRDIYLQIPGVAGGNRLNAADVYGGPALLLQTIRQNFGIPVDRYIAVDFFSFIKVIDALGGVEGDVSAAEMTVANTYIRQVNALQDLPEDDGLIPGPGRQLLSGKQALGYVRIRYVGSGDFERTDRQRLILQEVFKKIRAQNLSGLNHLLNLLLPEVTTNLSKAELATLLLRVPFDAGDAVESWRVPADGTFSYATVRGMSVLQIDFSKNIAELQKRIYG